MWLLLVNPKVETASFFLSSVRDHVAHEPFLLVAGDSLCDRSGQGRARFLRGEAHR
jgi:hypothetical protein